MTAAPTSGHPHSGRAKELCNGATTLGLYGSGGGDTAAYRCSLEE